MGNVAGSSISIIFPIVNLFLANFILLRVQMLFCTDTKHTKHKIFLDFSAHTHTKNHRNTHTHNQTQTYVDFWCWSLLNLQFKRNRLELVGARCTGSHAYQSIFDIVFVFAFKCFAIISVASF